MANTDKAQKALEVQNNYDHAIKNWVDLSSKDTIFGQFFDIFNQLGKISTSISKIAETAENSIKVLGL